jgi:hypothetical protein
MYIGLHRFTCTVVCRYCLLPFLITHVLDVKEWSGVYLAQACLISPKQLMVNSKLARPEICTLFVPYILISHTSGAMIRLVGKPQLCYLGSHIIWAHEVPYLPRHACSFARAMSVPEFAIAYMLWSCKCCWAWQTAGGIM